MKEKIEYDQVKHVKLTARIRVGTKKMIFHDITNMDIGSIIETNTLANEPLELLMGDRVVALGEVVTVDGNFGLQITEMVGRNAR